MELFSECLFCWWVPLAEVWVPAQLTHSNTDNLIIQTLPESHSPVLPSTFLLAPSYGSFLSINPLHSDGPQGSVLGPRLSSSHNPSLGHCTPSHGLDADKPPNSHCQHRPLPESQALRSLATSHQPSVVPRGPQPNMSWQMFVVPQVLCGTRYRFGSYLPKSFLWPPKPAPPARHRAKSAGE